MRKNSDNSFTAIDILAACCKSNNYVFLLFMLCHYVINCYNKLPVRFFTFIIIIISVSVLLVLLSWQ